MIPRTIQRISIALSLVATFGMITLPSAGNNTHIAYAAGSEKASSNSAISAYDKLPLSFIANAGQVDPSIRFQVRDNHGSLSFALDGVTLRLPPRTTAANSESIASTIHLTYDGMNPNVVLNGESRLPGSANFFYGNEPSNWHTNVPIYAGISYREIYPGIDLQYVGHAGLLKGTYTIAANADPSVIRWHYSNVNSVAIDPASGNLVINAQDGIRLTENAPVAWQFRHGIRTPVTVGYHIGSDDALSFVIAPSSYDPALPLTLDPGLDYSTYLGGSANDQGTGIAVDSSGDAYITGLTFGSFGTGGAFPTTSGAYQTYTNGNFDTFVSKLNPSGTALIYSTFIGGSGLDQANAIGIDPAGNAYITGYTYSTDFPVTANAYQKINSNYNVNGFSSIDAFVTKLNPAGNALVYSTYLGGTGFDAANGIKVDGGGNVYVVGVTNGTNFPTTAGAFQPTFGGGAGDAFVAKLNPAGSALAYSTYLGGAGNDAANKIDVDASGNTYITGLTSGNFRITSGVIESVYGGGVNDAFVTKLSPTGTGLVYSTYLGGTGNDVGNAIAIDSTGNVYVAGETTSPNYPLIAGSYQLTFGGGTNGFITKLDATGHAGIYSTYLGGNSDTQITALAIDGNGNAYVTGLTSGALPITSQAEQIAMGGGGSDAFIARLNSAGSTLTYSSYLGGNGRDYPWGMALDASLNLYVVGQTSGSFPVTGGAVQTTYGGLSTDAFVSKLTIPAQPDLARMDTIGIYRGGTFYLRLHNNTGNADITLTFNVGSRPYPIVGDWTGSGYDTVGSYDQSNGLFTLCTTNSTASCANVANQKSLVLGTPNDTPLSGRWATTVTNAGVGVFRPTNGILYMKNGLSTGYADFSEVLGIPGDQGLAGDWTGKGFDSPGVYRSSGSTFYLSNKVTNGSVYADLNVGYGIAGDTAVVGDWIGQGHDGIGLFRQTNGYTYLKNSLVTGYADNGFTYGIAGDVPVAGHWQIVYPPLPPLQVLVAKTSTPKIAGTAGSAPNDNPIGD